MPTLEAFISAISGFEKKNAGDQVDYLAYYATAVAGQESVTAAQIDELRDSLHLPRFRTAQYLSEGARRKRGQAPRFVKKTVGYALERGTQQTLRGAVGTTTTAVATSTSARALAAKITTPNAREYLEEAIGCFEHGFMRAAIVMSWCVGYDALRTWLFKHHLAALNLEMAKWKRSRTITRIDEFDELTERTVLDTAREASVLTKNEHKVLVALLDQRNSYAHATGRSASIAVTEAFLQQVTDEMLVRFL